MGETGLRKLQYHHPSLLNCDGNWQKVSKYTLFQECLKLVDNLDHFKNKILKIRYKGIRVMFYVKYLNPNIVRPGRTFLRAVCFPSAVTGL